MLFWIAVYVLLSLVGGEVGLALGRRSSFKMTDGAAYLTGFVFWPVMVIITVLCLLVFGRAIFLKLTKGDLK